MCGRLKNYQRISFDPEQATSAPHLFALAQDGVFVSMVEVTGQHSGKGA
jgi:hypothetical protein